MECLQNWIVGQDSNSGSLAPEPLLLPLGCTSYFSQIDFTGQGFLYHHQINMTILDSEKLISQTRGRLTQSCTRDPSHQSCWFLCTVAGFSEMEPLCLEHLFPSQASEQSRPPSSLPTDNQPAPPQPMLALAQPFRPNQELMDGALK